MSRPSQTLQPDDLGQRGGWRFTREYVVEPELIHLFHGLYETAFGPLRVRSIARQVLTAREFGDQMRDGDVLKYVAWTAGGEPVGICTMTNRLATVPWISPEYFAAAYPEQWARDAVWYLGFLLAHPSQRHARFIDQIIEVGLDDLAGQQAVCAYDMCAYNVDQLGLAARAAVSLRRAAGVSPVRSDVQSYYTLDFSEGDATSGDRPTTGMRTDVVAVVRASEHPGGATRTTTPPTRRASSAPRPGSAGTL